MKTDAPHTLLIIAGSDPCGGAGLQTDIRTATEFGVYTAAVPTAITVQNSHGLTKCHPLSASLLKAQLEAIVDDFIPEAVKIGLLTSSKEVEVIAEFIKKYNLKNVVLDPVMSPTKGGRFSSKRIEFATAIYQKLLPLCTIATPNLREFEIWKSHFPAASTSHHEDYIPPFILLTGGDTDEKVIEDILYDIHGTEICSFRHSKIDTPNLHGTGCAFSTAIASSLAKGKSIMKAIAKAENYMADILDKYKNLRLGKAEYGPTNFGTSPLIKIELLSKEL